MLFFMLDYQIDFQILQYRNWEDFKYLGKTAQKQKFSQFR